MNGFAILGEMTRDELIEEVMGHQRELANQHSDADLKAMIIEYRLADTRKRLEKEAGIVVTRSMFGTSVDEADES